MPQAYHDPTFLKEVWGLFGVGASILLARTFVRLRTVGLRNFAGDDFLSLAVLVCYMGDAITVNINYKLGTNLDFTQEQFSQMTPEQLHEVEIGSRMELLAWFSYTALIWALKVCMIFFYYRLTAGLPLQRHLKWLSWATGISYVVVFLTVTCGCYPIQKNWQITPDPGEKCTFKTQNFYVTTIMNVITDAAILCVPLPLLWRLQVTWQKKFGLALLLTPGIFVIAAALVRVVMSLSANPSALNVNRWGVRETIAGVIAVNVPILRPLFLKSFWRPGYKAGNRAHPSSYGKKSSKGRATENSSAYEMYNTPQTHDRSSKQSKPGWATTTTVLKELNSRSSSDNVRPDASSEEFIIQKSAAKEEMSPRNSTERDVEVEKGMGGVLISTTFESDTRSRYVPSRSGKTNPWEDDPRVLRKDGHGNHVVIGAGN